MPSAEALNSMSQLIARCNWDQLQYPDHRAQVMSLAIADERNAILDAIEGHLGEVKPLLEQVGTHLEELTNHTDHMALWFEKSKLWEGRLL
jgi:hypothetical protein